MQAYQPQAPYQSPVYLAPPPTPQQSDPIDSAAKVLDLFSRLQQVNGGGNFAPGQTQQASASVGQMAPVNPQQIAYQEALLRNPELARQQQTQVEREPGSLQLNAQQSQQLQQGIQAILQGAQQHYQHYQIAMQMCAEIMNAFNAVSTYAGELEKTLYVAHQYKLHSDAFAQELDAAHEMINVLKAMLTNPEYLVSHAFTVWDNTLQGNIQGLDEFISPAYMQLVANVEERYKQQSGQYSPKYSEYLQQRINQQPTQQQQVVQPQQQQPGNADYIRQFAEMLNPSGYNTSELGAAIRRQHIQRLRG